jgi:hypothetical protein
VKQLSGRYNLRHAGNTSDVSALECMNRKRLDYELLVEGLIRS